MSTELPSPRIALTQAHRLLLGGDIDAANAWICLAKELREGAMLPEQPADRLTLHDVEGIVCAHGRVVVRRRDSTKRSEWWRHADSDPTVCDDVQQETESMRRNGVEQADAQFWEGSRPTSGPMPADTPAVVEGFAPATVSTVIEMPDKIAGYERGQILPPTLPQLRYAEYLRDHLAAGRGMPFGLSESLCDIMLSLVDEIVNRAQERLPQTTPSDLDQTTVLATRVRVPPARPAAVPPADYGVCVHCGMDVSRVAETGRGDAVKYRHDYTDQQVCQGQRTQSGDETFVHTFAWPAPQG